MSYKLLSDHKDHFMVQHPDGSSFPVAKKGLGKSTLDKISKYEPVKMADGGIVPGLEASPVEPEPTPINVFNPSIQDKPISPEMMGITQSSSMSDPGKALFGTAQPTYFGTNVPMEQSKVDPSAVPEELKQLNQPTTPPPQVTPAQSGSMPDQPPKSPQDSMNAYPGYKEMNSGIQMQAKAANDFANQSAKIWEESARQQKEVHDQYQGHLKAVDDKIQTISNDVMNGKIDPNRVWSNMSTGNRVMAGIALVLGGIGAGLTGKSNAALDVINKSIDNDIDAQKAEMGKKNNLLSHYMQQYHNIQAAENATRIHLASIVGAQINKVASQSGSAQAQAAAQLATGQLKQTYAPMVQKQALTGLMQQMSGSGDGEGGLPADQEAKLLPFLSANDKDYNAKRVLVNGRVYQHTGVGSDAQNQRIFEAKLKPIYDAVKELDTLGPSALVRGTEAYNRAHSIRAGMATSIAGLKSTEIGSSKINGEEADRALEQINDPTSFSQMISGGGVRNQEFFKDLNNVAESTRKQNLIGYKGRPQTFEYKAK